MANYNVSTVYRGIDKASPVMDKMSRNALKNSQKVEGAFGRMSKRAGASLGRGAMRVAKYGAVAATGLAVYATKNAIQNMLEFESEMLNVRAITKSTESDYKSMSNAALGMAKKSVFTSKQVAEGMKFLGIAGWETTKIIEGMPGVLQLAAATQSDLALTSDMLSDSMSAFRIEASRATHVADVFAGVTTSTNTTIEQLKEAVKDAAPAAMDFGVSIEQTSAILGMMANNGIKGSRAGTAFRNMTMRLASPSKNAQKWLKRLNVEVVDGKGRFRDINDIMDDTRKGLSGLTEQQQAQAKEAIFGKRAISGVNAVLADQSGKVRELTKDFKENTGVAQKMANVQLSGAIGAVKRMNSAWDALSITLAQKVAPALVVVYNRLNRFIAEDTSSIADYWANVFSDSPVGRGADIQQSNIQQIVDVGKRAKITSPIPSMRDERFRTGWERYRKMRESGIEENEALKRIRRNAYSEKAAKLFRDMYDVEKLTSKQRVEKMKEHTKEIREIYDIKLKSEDVKTPMSSFVEKVTKQENTLIIKAPRGAAEIEGATPKYLKLVETF